MNELDFYAYSMHVQQKRNYHPNWTFVIFKAKFGKWVTKTQKKATQAKEPTKEYLDWLEQHQREWLESKRADDKNKPCL
ncbi:hypothetical protein [Acinetobacter sp. WCHAc060007]|uniref:hypothetical protein n=1 Tax=Acinetobacter sp. WCHAc060007 TaxID=2419605 RepID=UPI000EA32CF5|nr:hypothetical protein [Acinetobacter sp. WCHAc060007]RKG44875.1 hypothetical protein D7V31_01390 [Acinetobacter sp. WCHAc060007]